MNQWYVKELSEITQVSVQTLHHYDRIGLLKPSMRLANGYRLYSEGDLLKLQQIIALKFFGFELNQIKNLIDENVDIIEHFSIQARFLEEKAQALSAASQTLKKIIAENSQDKSLHWKNVIKLIEVYRMAQQLEKTWAGKIFTSEELKTYANFEHDLKQRYSQEEMLNIEKQWAKITKDVSDNLSQDPTSAFGIALGKRCMNWVNAYYGKKYAALRNIIWEKGFKQNAIDEATISKDVFSWLDQAISAYFRSRIIHVLSLVDKESHNSVIKQWEALLTEMHGDDTKGNEDVFEAILKNDNISQNAKDFVQQYRLQYSS